jgi:alanyl-tRNA synthetase
MKESKLLDTSRKINRYDVYYISEAGPRIWKQLHSEWSGTIVDFMRLQNIDALDKIDIVLSGNFLDNYAARRILLICLKKVQKNLATDLLVAKQVEKILQQNIKDRNEFDEKIGAIREELEKNMETYRSQVSQQELAFINVIHMCLSWTPSIGARNALFTLMDNGLFTKEQSIQIVHSVFYPRRFK